MPRRPRRAAVALASLPLLLAATLLLPLPPLVSTAHAQNEAASADDADEEDLLGGFDDADEEDLLGGFDDEDDGDADGEYDLLGGFGDDEADDPDEAEDASTSAGGTSESWLDRYLDVTGSVSLGASYNLVPHCASVAPASGAGPFCTARGEGTFYGNLQRLRLRGDAQLDAYLPFDWKGRAQFSGWYDFAYLMHGQQKYTQLVLDEYQLRGEVLDLYLEGPLLSWLDLKVGRQVVNWGRSDTLRVNDVLNPLNNLEPGIVDIEDLRLPTTMVKLDAYWWKLDFTAIVVPEIRYDWDPPPGSDFYPEPDFSDIPAPPPSFPLTKQELIPIIEALVPESSIAANFETVDQWGAEPEYAGAVTAIFSGWDASFFAARVYQNRTSPVINLPAFGAPPSIVLRDDRVTMIGAGANYTVGSWLFKAELSWFDEFDYVYLLPIFGWTIADGLIPYEAAHAQVSRIDYMLGIEYYGITDTTLALEVAHRHVLDYNYFLQFVPNYVYEDNVEIAFRIRRDLMNTRLATNFVGVVLLNSQGFFGSTIRVDAEYELAEALTLSGGLLYFVGGDIFPFDGWRDNERLFAKIKYSF